MTIKKKRAALESYARNMSQKTRPILPHKSRVTKMTILVLVNFLWSGFNIVWTMSAIHIAGLS